MGVKAGLPYCAAKCLVGGDDPYCAAIIPLKEIAWRLVLITCSDA